MFVIEIVVCNINMSFTLTLKKLGYVVVYGEILIHAYFKIFNTTNITTLIYNVDTLHSYLIYLFVASNVHLKRHVNNSIRLILLDKDRLILVSTSWYKL